MNKLMINKIKAFSIHFSLSFMVLFSFLSLVYFLWYPSPLLDAEGGFKIVMILVGVDVIVGPLITFIIYKPGKKYLKLDLTMIVIVQLAAFIYGGAVISSGRPLYVVFDNQKFNIADASSIDLTTLKDKNLKHQSILSKPVFVISDFSYDGENKSQVMSDLMFSRKKLAFLPKYYIPMASNLNKMMDKGIRYERIIERHPEQKKVINTLLEYASIAQEKAAFFVLDGNVNDFVLVLNKETGQIVGSLDVDPWLLMDRKQQE